jgi:hypothetical protein
MASDPDSSEFLLKCLHLANIEPDLIDDVVGICDLAGLTARKLAEDGFSVQDAARKLFLTVDEAEKLLEVCRKQCSRACSGQDEGEAARCGSEAKWHYICIMIALIGVDCTRETSADRARLACCPSDGVSKP